MNELQIAGWIAGALQFAVALYALRLSRRYGTSRVGWSLFGAFALLAVLHLVQSSLPFSGGFESALIINVAYTLISFLLLIGLLHLETMLKERLRTEQLEAQLRTNLESEVKAKTAHLNRALEELMREVEETKRISAILEFTETALMRKEDFAKKDKTFSAQEETVPQPAAAIQAWVKEPASPFPLSFTHGELLAQF